MRRVELLQAVDQAVQVLLPELPRPEHKAVAGLVVGVVCAERAHLSQASASIPGAAQDRSKLRRVQRLLANPRLDVARAPRRLLGRVLAQRQGRLDLLVDATTTSASAHQAGSVTLCLALAWRWPGAGLALAWHGRALPLLWRTWVADAPGQDWRDRTGGTGLAGQDWRDRTGGTGLAGRAARVGADPAERAGGGGAGDWELWRTRGGAAGRSWPLGQRTGAVGAGARLALSAAGHAPHAGARH